MQPSGQSIALIGPSGAGKSTVGVGLAQALGWRFIDLDQLIIERAEKSISDIFSQEGEAGFRERETAALVQALQTDQAVIACGGGIVLREVNRQLLREQAWCVYLTSAISTLVKRLTADQANPRPLLASDINEQLVIQLAERLPLYSTLANWTIQTDGLAPQIVVEQLIRAWGLVGKPQVSEVFSSFNSRYYVKSGALAALPNELANLGLTGTCWLISDSHVGPMYAPSLIQALENSGFTCQRYDIPAQEASKSWQQAGELYTWLLENGVQRGDTVLALGGGVVGDLAGFIAASILRGIAVVQLPTTILAMIDSSIGGKTGINHPRGKNLIGAFHPPRLVLIDDAVLSSLPRRERAAGWAEAVKHGVIADAQLFDDLERAGASLNDVPAKITSDLLVRSAAVKIGVVNRDERETGERMLLNYGHTLGQAVEAATQYKRYVHGEAVAIGMTFAANLAVQLGMWTSAEAERQRALLQALNLPTALPRDLDIEATLAALNLDKKRAKGSVRWVLPTRIGHAQVESHVDPELVRKLVHELVEQA